MKVLHVVHGYPPSVGGCQWLAMNLSERLVSRYGDCVTVYTTTAYNMELFWRTDEPAMPAGTETIRGVVVRRFPVKNRYGWLRMLAAHSAHRLRLPFNDWLRTLYNGPLIAGMTKAVASSGADIVLAMAFPHMQMYYALAGARRGGIPTVLLGAIHVADRMGYERPMMYRAIQKANAYVALTAYERDHLLGRGVQGGKVVVIGPGVDAQTYARADGAAVRQRYGWQNDPVVALIAKQSPRKQIDVLISAMRQVWGAYPNTRLLLAGARTAYSPHVRDMVRGLALEQQAQVTVLDDFVEEDKPALLAACDLLVLPSGYESFGIAFLEAWACGKPVIGARVGAIPSVIDEGHDGLLTHYQDSSDLASAIQKLIADPQRARQMGEAGRGKVLQRHTWDAVTDQLRTLYSSVIAEHAGRPARGRPAD